MCLAVPGQLISIESSGEDEFGAEGMVDFQGTRVKVSLALVPAISVGSWVLVHAGMALETLDEDEARKTWRYLSESGVPGMPESFEVKE